MRTVADSMRIPPSALPWIPLLPLWPHAARCGFAHRLAHKLTALAADRRLRRRPPSAAPWAHEMPLLPLWPRAECCVFCHRAHDEPLLPLWPHAGGGGFRHRLPSPVLTKCQPCHPDRMRTVAASATVYPPCSQKSASATLAARGTLRIRPPSALLCAHEMSLPRCPHADSGGFGYRLPSHVLTKCHCHSACMRTVADSGTVCHPLCSRNANPATLACAPLQIRPPSALPLCSQNATILPLWSHAE